jgi:hypothetical protein
MGSRRGSSWASSLLGLLGVVATTAASFLPAVGLPPSQFSVTALDSFPVEAVGLMILSLLAALTPSTEPLFRVASLSRRGEGNLEPVGSVVAELDVRNAPGPLR